VRIILATGNAHKKEEIGRILTELGLPLTIVEPGVALPEVIEDGDTLEANAIKKAREVASALGMIALADDTGLEIDALGGAPGHHAARWAGPECIATDNVAKALRELEGVSTAERTARFRCVMALVSPAGDTLKVSEGVVEGRIAETASGGGGFGYDPIFELPERGCTMAELDEGEKNRLSHRYRALAALGELLAG
jgi:XTP/dITP diphosphohydrolase